ncbi:MAG TPA: class I SAM-dependent methyltransferase [Alphaproteobacteria bacterium]|nr:class I SAM-dependent methyltransferase [Alphaproteobacteria bacterium]
MSRLDSFIRRAVAQRDCLNDAARRTAGLEGPVIELGLGNGRTYDHLRRLLPGREIFVFERRVAAHPDCVPDDGHLILGDFRATIPGAMARLGAPAALLHGDVGSGDAVKSAALAAWLGPAIRPLLAPGAVVVFDQALKDSGLDRLEPPAGVDAERYFMYRAGAA